MKKTTRKKIASSICAVFFACSLCVNVCAQELESLESNTQELVDVNGYQCRIVDGEYVTNIDGKEYTVIDLGDLSVPSENTSCYSANTAAAYDTPGSWNTSSISITKGSEYRDAFNLYFDYRSPKYEVGPNPAWSSAYIRADYIIPRTIKIQVYTYDDMNGWQLRTKETGDNNGFVSASLSSFRTILFTGSATTIVSRIAFRVLSDGVGKDIYAYYFGLQ